MHGSLTVLLAELCAIVLMLVLLLLLFLHWLSLPLLIGGHDAAEAGRDWPGSSLRSLERTERPGGLL